MLPGTLLGSARLLLQPVQPPVLTLGFALRLLHPLDEEDSEEDQPDDVAGAPEQTTRDVLVTQR